MQEVTDVSDQVELVFQTGQGDMLLSFDSEGNAGFLVDDLEIQVSIVGLADFTFFLQGEGAAQYAADESLIATWGHTQDLASAGGGEVSGRPAAAEAVLVLTPEQVFIAASSETLTLVVPGVPEDAQVTPYECEGNSLILNPDGTQSSSWTRVPGA
jgi:hypothetical protein